MAYVIPANSCIEIRLTASQEGQKVMNVFHYQNPDEAADGATSIQEALAEFESLVWNALRPMLTVQFLNVELHGQYVHPVRYRTEIHQPENTTGEIEGEALPLGCAAVVRRNGEAANRHNQGRIYVCGLPKAAVAASILTPTFVSANGAALEDMMLDVLTLATEAAWFPIIWSAATPAERIKVVGSKLDNIVRYQRRREIGVGQ